MRFWQCDNEPSNTGLLWAGTAEEYLAQLSTMYGAVKRADPDALVVLGGCGYDALTSAPDGRRASSSISCSTPAGTRSTCSA